VARTPTPVLRGNLPMRVVVCFAGCSVFAYGIALMIASGAGLAPWDVLHQGLARHLGITFGAAAVVVGVVVGGAAWRLGQPVGWSTLVNMLTIGPMVNVWHAAGLVPNVSDGPVVVRLAQNAAGIALMAVGSGLYIGAGRSAGPRDSLMIAISAHTGLRVALARNSLELAALALGVALGGTVGVGTVLFAVGIGPAVEAAFWVLWRSPLVLPAAEQAFAQAG
jgi:uncharacterized protein